MGLIAKQWERIGKRISTSFLKSKNLSDDASEHIEVIKDDMWHNIETTLNKDGNTGKLTTPDGLLHGKPQIYKGFFVQCFAGVRYTSDLDIYGKLYWFGFAKKEIQLKGKKSAIRFETDKARPFGFDSEYDCGKWLFNMIDNYYGAGKN